MLNSKRPKIDFSGDIWYIGCMNATKFWNRVKAQLRARKISQAELAKHLEMSPATLYGWIHYKRIPNIVTALYIAAALGVSLEYLAFGEDGKAMRVQAKQVKERKIATARIKKLNSEIEKEIKRL